MGTLTVVVVIIKLHFGSIVHRCTDTDHPGSHTDTDSTCFLPSVVVRPVLQHHNKETINAHGSQTNDAAVHTSEVHRNDELAQKVPKDPVFKMISCPEWEGESEYQIRAGQVHHEDFCHKVEFFKSEKNPHEDNVSYDADDGDNDEQITSND